MLKIFGAVFVFWVVAGLLSPLRLTNWDWGLLLLGCSAVAGYWRFRSGTSLPEAVTGVTVAVVLLAILVTLVASRVEAVTFAESSRGAMYVALASGAAAGLGFGLAWLASRGFRSRA